MMSATIRHLLGVLGAEIETCFNACEIDSSNDVPSPKRAETLMGNDPLGMR